VSQCEGVHLSLVSYSHDGGGIGIGGVGGGGCDDYYYTVSFIINPDQLAIGCRTSQL